MPKPDGEKEDLGITTLDEPTLNPEDKSLVNNMLTMIIFRIELNQWFQTNRCLDFAGNADSI